MATEIRRRRGLATERPATERPATERPATERAVPFYNIEKTRQSAIGMQLLLARHIGADMPVSPES